MPMDQLPPKVPPTAASAEDVREALVPVQMRVRGDQIVGLVDHMGNELGMPLTVIKSDGGVGNMSAAGAVIPLVSKMEKWGFLGHSLTAGAVSAPTASGNWLNDGWLTFFRRAMFGRIACQSENVFAIAGSSGVSFRDVQVPKAIAAGCTKVTLLTGGNSIDSEGLIGPIGQGLDALKAAGIVVFASPVIVRGDPSSFTADQIKKVDAYNRWLAQRAKDDASIVLVDGNRHIADHTTGLPLANMLRDGIHPQPQGAFLLAKPFVEAADKYAPPRKGVWAIYGGQYDATLNPYGDLAPTNFAGTGGIKGANVDAASVVPTGWTATRHSGTSNIGALWTKTLIDNRYQGVNVALSGTGTGFYTSMTVSSTAVPSGVVAGDRIRLSVGCRMSSDCAGVLGPYIMLQSNGAPNVSRYDGLQNDTRNALVTDTDMILSIDITVPDSPETLQPWLGVQTKNGQALGGNVRFWIIECRKLLPGEI
ncbi:SGNH/GDSL hydrolase family protein [Zoogloea sp. 1C4]|uniref:SGNH/GDSL hydrolase family protein n=1 Tax=Zoogloea sp. 1C4 TaxID=2570190 RepID=UPI00129271C0|nr:SGNH/GDSL hydrolase family protein [Zoogloea sp. 1C4]